jgi:hypothetical protein
MPHFSCQNQNITNMDIYKYCFALSQNIYQGVSQPATDILSYLKDQARPLSMAAPVPFILTIGRGLGYL